MRALLRAVSNVLRLVLLPLWLVGRASSRPKQPWLELRLAPHVRDLAAKAPLWQRLVPSQQRKRQSTSLEDLREAARAIAKDPRIQGVLVHLPALEAGWAACASLRDVIVSLRSAGKQVVCYLAEGGGSHELYVALAASRVILAPPASISPLGVAAQPFFVKRLLDRLGITVQVQTTGEYKSAAEPALRESMSEPSREQSAALIDTLHEALLEALRARPAMDEARIAAVFARGVLSAHAAKTLGLIDDVAYEDELNALLGIDLPAKQRLMSVGRYLQRSRARIWKPVRAEPYIAVVPVRGTIVNSATLPVGSRGAELATVVAALRQAAHDPHARAVVLYVSSPGGSAHASDLIHREVQRLAKLKPVVAYFGDVAASGGYYVGAACKRIVAQPVSITGSIGVISMKLAIDGLLDTLGVRFDVLKTTEHVDMFSAARKLSPEEDRIMLEHATELYGRFLEVVAEGRGKTKEEVHEVARGRVWSGRDAKARGLVDVLGGFDVALAEARALVPDLTELARSTLQPHMVEPHGAEPPPPLRDERAENVLAAWLPDAAALALGTLHHEPCLYYAPFDSTGVV